MHQTAEQYKSQRTTTVNHFFEKLLLLKDRMNTPAAIKIANERHQYMVDFLGNFLRESTGEESVHYKILSSYKEKS